ncbi:sugar transferase [uncultured Sulfitobacter sp.]|uniref:sugar transferase n=1 Tax=uncultured Sulfitobacter sp. TaxID=191468 RepID=UPI0030D7E002|tara:strand:- start:71848 stop:72447 length:600 start_codon:yes stop_codon:yes gene_type:complete
MMKRAFDICGAVVGLLLLSPILLIIFFMVHRDMGSPILFRQIRPGKNATPFEMVKFRSMRDAADHNGMHLPDDERLTAFGRKLRASSLDELPELWNVLKGEMSLVGPRPLLMEYLPLYSSEQARRMDVRPGITGWAQINGRNAVGWDEKFALDIWYIDNRSVWLDIKILFLTVRRVLARDGISAEGQVTMSKFKGNFRR